MIAGHFGFAALVKSKERSTPLWLLMFSSVWLDIVFVPLFVAGIEPFARNGSSIELLRFIMAFAVRKSEPTILPL